VVDVFHMTGFAGGGDKDAPGCRDTRQGYPSSYHAAFVPDQDGSNIEAVCRPLQRTWRTAFRLRGAWRQIIGMQW
jgi:hypothetical protein